MSTVLRELLGLRTSGVSLRVSTLCAEGIVGSPKPLNPTPLNPKPLNPETLIRQKGGVQTTEPET